MAAMGRGRWVLGQRKVLKSSRLKWLVRIQKHLAEIVITQIP